MRSSHTYPAKFYWSNISFKQNYIYNKIETNNELDM